MKEVIEELTPAEFEKLSESGTQIDYDEVWELIEGRFLTTAGFVAAVNKVRGLSGKNARPVYYSEKKRMFDKWESQGRKVVTKVGYFPNATGKKVRQNVYQFGEIKKKASK